MNEVDGTPTARSAAVRLGTVTQGLGDFFWIGHVDVVHGVMGRIGGFWSEREKEEVRKGGKGAEDAKKSSCKVRKISQEGRREGGKEGEEREKRKGEEKGHCPPNHPRRSSRRGFLMKESIIAVSNWRRCIGRMPRLAV